MIFDCAGLSVGQGQDLLHVGVEDWLRQVPTHGEALQSHLGRQRFYGQISMPTNVSDLFIRFPLQIRNAIECSIEETCNSKIDFSLKKDDWISRFHVTSGMDWKQCWLLQISLLEVGDTDKDGKITIAEWLALWSRYLAKGGGPAREGPGVSVFRWRGCMGQVEG